MRGDRPPNKTRFTFQVQFTPHARGSTPDDGFQATLYAVYPACAGIDPSLFSNSPSLFRLPRMRGDRPKARLSVYFPRVFTPHADRPVRGDPMRLAGYPACGIGPLHPVRLMPLSFTRMRDRPQGQEQEIRTVSLPHARDRPLLM